MVRSLLTNLEKFHRILKYAQAFDPQGVIFIIKKIHIDHYIFKLNLEIFQRYISENEIQLCGINTFAALLTFIQWDKLIWGNFSTNVRNTTL